MKKATVKKVLAGVLEEVLDDFLFKVVWRICWDYADTVLKDPEDSAEDLVAALRKGASPDEYFTRDGVKIIEAAMKLQDKIDELA